MDQENKQLEAAFKDPESVIEAATLYDTILVSRLFYGQEQSVRGWFSTFAAMAASPDIRFFKVRTEGTAGLPYCNQQSADSMDFPFMAYSMGVTFFAPASNMMGETKYHTPDGSGLTNAANVDPGVPHFWTFDLPRHAAIALKTNQDVRTEVTAYACPPGYGPMGGGAALEIPLPAQGVTLYRQHAQLNTFGTQGVPVLTNRFKFPAPIVIPKNATIEGVLYLSTYARTVLAGLSGPLDYLFQAGDTMVQVEKFPMRFGVQMSLMGYRLVQQRGQYHV